MLAEISYPNNIAMVRKIRGLTQAYVAVQIGVSRPKYIEIEKGQKELTVSQLEKLKTVLDASFEDLIGIDTGKIDFRDFIAKQSSGPGPSRGEVELEIGSVRAFWDKDKKEWWLAASDVAEIFSGFSEELRKLSSPGGSKINHPGKLKE